MQILSFRGILRLVFNNFVVKQSTTLFKFSFSNLQIMYKCKYEWKTIFLWKEIWSIRISVNQSFTRNLNLSFSCFRRKWLDWSINMFLKQRICFKFCILRRYFRKIFVRDLEQCILFSSPDILGGLKWTALHLLYFHLCRDFFLGGG